MNSSVVRRERPTSGTREASRRVVGGHCEADNLYELTVVFVPTITPRIGDASSLVAQRHHSRAITRLYLVSVLVKGTSQGDSIS